MNTKSQKRPSNSRTTIASASVILTCIGLVGCAGITGGGGTSIDSDAAAILKATCDKLASAQQFTFRGTRTVDPDLVPGRKLKVEGRIEGAVARPNRFSGLSSGSNSTQRFYYDGENVTLYDPKANHYATVPGSNTIDRTIDKIVANWNFHPPLTDLLVSDPYASLSKRATSGKLVGTETLRGTKCHHIAVTQDAVDFDVWISASDNLPRRMVITFKAIEGSPKVKADISSWNLNPELSASQFDFTPPKGAQKIEMVPAGN